MTEAIGVSVCVEDRTISRELRRIPVSRSDAILENARVVHHDHVTTGSLAFDGGRVVSAPPSGAPRIDLRDHLIFPGLINAHDHLQLNAIQPLPHERPFANSYEWSDAVAAWRTRPGVAASVAIHTSVRHWHGALKNLLAGATTVAHHDPLHAICDDVDFPVGVLRNSGWSHSLGLGATTRGHAERYGPEPRISFAATSPDHPWIIHLAEGIDGVAAAELAELEAMGCLASNTVLVHGVALGCDAVDRVIARDAAVIWCPASNIAMFGRTIDPRRLFDAGRLALGSDSRLTGSRDLLDELRVAAAKSDLQSHELLRLVTADASHVLRLRDCGRLESGAQADCVIIRAGSDPYGDLLSTRRADIRAVVRGGVPLVADLDFAEWFADCGVPTLEIRLDGKAKLLSRQVANAEALALEPGLTIT